MTPKREALIREVWADQRRFRDWNPHTNPVWSTSVWPKPMFPSINTNTPAEISMEHLDFKYEKGLKDGHVPWFRITCEGLVVSEGPR